MDKWIVGLGVIVLFASVIVISASFSNKEEVIVEMAPSSPPGNPIMNSTSWECAAIFKKNDTVCLKISEHINWSRLIEADRNKYFYIKITGPNNGNFIYELTYTVPEGQYRLTILNLSLYNSTGDDLVVKHNVAEVSRKAGYTIVAGLANYEGVYRAIIMWEDTYPPITPNDKPSYLGFFRGHYQLVQPYSSSIYIGAAIIPFGGVLIYYGAKSEKKRRHRSA
jgi:hypothetical protein